MIPSSVKLGLLSPGGTPSDDIHGTFTKFLGKRVSIIIKGAFDGLDDEGLHAMEAQSGEIPLETQLRPGVVFGLSKHRVMSRLILAAKELSHTCDRVLLLCSGEFPDLAKACPDVIQPIVMLRGILTAAAHTRLLGLIGPADDLPAAPAQWRPYVPSVICAAASSTQPLTEIATAGRFLADQNVDLIYMDCMGFTENQRQAVVHKTGLPVLAATTLVARSLCEIL